MKNLKKTSNSHIGHKIMFASVNIVDTYLKANQHCFECAIKINNFIDKLRYLSMIIWLLH
jgi:hypothetical protein